MLQRQCHTPERCGEEVKLDHCDEEEEDCEFFVGKRNVERMVKSISILVRELAVNVHDNYPKTLTSETLGLALNKISNCVRFLGILINDQLVDIKRYAEDILLDAQLYVNQSATMFKQPIVQANCIPLDVSINKQSTIRDDCFIERVSSFNTPRNGQKEKRTFESYLLGSI